MAGRWLVLVLLVAAGLARGAPPDVLVEGQVVDDATGAPIASAMVTVWDSRYAEPPATTDTDGRFRLVRETVELVAGRQRVMPQVVVRAPGWAPAAIRPYPYLIRGEHTGLVVRLSRPIPLAGRVVDPGGAPLEGARVQVMGTLRDEGGGCEEARDHFCGPVEWDWEATTDRDGQFTIDDLASDEPGLARVHVVVTSPGRRQLGRKGREVRLDDPPLEVVLAPEATLAGTVVDPGGDPIVRARVSRYELDRSPDTSRRSRPREEDAVDRSDRFLVRELERAVWHVQDRGPGRVVWGDAGDDRRVRRNPGLITLTRPDGTFELRPLTPGRRWFLVAAPGYGERLVELEAPATGVRVVLAPEGRLRGQLLCVPELPRDSTRPKNRAHSAQEPPATPKPSRRNHSRDP